MLYQKPKDLKYTDMAIYIDQYLDQKEVPEEVQCTIFEYLYHLVMMLARKGRFFNKQEYYEDFAVTLATDVYFRLFSPKRFEYDVNGKAKLSNIKSSLNYLKSIINFRKINFEQNNYAQIFLYQDEDDTCMEPEGYSFSDQISDSVNDLNAVEFKCCIEHIDSSIRQYLEKIPYRKNSIEWQNIYISVMLSFLYGITLSKTEEKRLECTHTPSYVSDMHTKFLQQESKKPVAILYHLDDSMYNYIVVLLREVKHFIASELATITNYDISSRDLSYLALSDINSNQYSYDYYSDLQNGDYN